MSNGYDNDVNKLYKLKKLAPIFMLTNCINSIRDNVIF